MNENKLFIPFSIIGAGVIIALAIFFSGGSSEQNLENNGQDNDGPTLEDFTGADAKDIEISPISSEDHILGNPDAEVIVVEYSDFECPFCARFHPSMEKILEEYGESGKVAWVYRHFPLPGHPNAQPAAEASECVAELGGNTAFWNYSKTLFENQRTSLSEEGLKEAAIQVGVAEEDYKNCLASGRHQKSVQEDFEDGVNIINVDPNFGTPYSLIITKDGPAEIIRGAQDYSVVKQVIDSLVSSE